PPSSLLFPYTTLFRSPLFGNSTLRPFAGEYAIERRTHICRIRSDQLVRANGHRFRTFGAVAHREARHTHHRRFLGHAAGIGDHGDRKSTRLNSSHRTI